MIGKLRTVVLDAAEHRAVASFYTELIGLTEQDADDEWITLKSADGWRVAVQQAPDHTSPRWPDQAHPQQFHLDLVVPDIDAAAQRAVSLGATRLGGGETWHVLADPAGHPFCLCRGEDPATKIFGVTLDCPDAKALSHFYSEVLSLPVTYEGDEGSMIGVEGGPQVMFQQVAGYQAPRWPDPAHPQQFHLDVEVTDVDAAEKQVLALGATKLPGGGDDFRVYADPAGHPFCLVF